jgi:hypothetical protein
MMDLINNDSNGFGRRWVCLVFNFSSNALLMRLRGLKGNSKLSVIGWVFKRDTYEYTSTAVTSV